MMALLLALCYNLSATQADYDGKTLSFNGKFQITHPMGRISAEKATLQNLQLHRQTKASQLTLENNVEIEVPDGKTPFTISAKRAFCELLPNTIFSIFQFQELFFYDQVEIRTLANLCARGGSAVYKLGTLLLFPSLPTNHCQLLRGEDRIDAHEIRFDLPNETLLCEAPRGVLHQGPLYFSSDKLIWHKKENTLELLQNVRLQQNNLLCIEGDHGSVTCREEFEPDTLTLQGNIRLISTRIQDKESFASADTITYHPADKTLVLSAASPKRVLFWQEGLYLSAPEIKIHLLAKNESIEGIGDIHFTFDPQEKDFFETLFSKYL